ncbi:MAG: hypothetical protein ABFR53_02800, partial [Actinomycetota bacterium]
MLSLLPIAQGREHDEDQTGDCSRSSTGAIPIPDLGEGIYLGEQGGLYPGGLNTLPREHEAAGLDLASQIEPLDEDGNRDANGAIAVLSIGVSNTFREFQDFITIVE